MWIDSHCHLDAAEFGGDALEVAAAAQRAGVSAIVIPAVHPDNFEVVAALARERSDCFYALGIHPMYVPHAEESDLQLLRKAVAAALADPALHPRFVAIGEIGLDFFIPELAASPLREKQEFFYAEQLKLARDFDLPVLLHVRRSQDIILKYLRRIQPAGGIAHAFNGSEQQAQTFIDLGFKLGFGGAMTYTRALQIRRLAQSLPPGSHRTGNRCTRHLAQLAAPGGQQSSAIAAHRRCAGGIARPALGAGGAANYAQCAASVAAHASLELISRLFMR